MAYTYRRPRNTIDSFSNVILQYDKAKHEKMIPWYTLVFESQERKSHKMQMIICRTLAILMFYYGSSSSSSSNCC